MYRDIRVLVVAKNRESRECYEAFLANSGVPLDSVVSLQEALMSASERAYNGVLIDLPTAVQASDSEKKYLYDLLESYPVGKVRAIPARQTISVISAGRCRMRNSTIDEFINQECRSFKARSCRSGERKGIHIPLIISPSADFPAEETEKTFSVNVSLGGFFIFTAGGWKTGDRVWIRMGSPAMADGPIMAEVRWTIGWGKDYVIPGIGVSFRELQETEKRAIFLLMYHAAADR